MVGFFDEKMGSFAEGFGKDGEGWTGEKKSAFEKMIEPMKDILKGHSPEPDYLKIATDNLAFSVSLTTLQLTAWTYARQELGFQASQEQLESFTKQMLRGFLNSWFKSYKGGIAAWAAFKKSTGQPTHIEKLLDQSPDQVAKKVASNAKVIIGLVAPQIFNLEMIKGLEAMAEEIKSPPPPDTSEDWKQGKPPV